MVADAEAAIAEVNSGLVAQGYYTSVVVLMNADRAALDAAARQVEKLTNRLGFAARIETVNCRRKSISLGCSFYFTLTNTYYSLANIKPLPLSPGKTDTRRFL